jgi:hypothetical protein
VLLGDRTKTFKKAAAEKSLAIQKLKFRQEAEQREKEFQEALKLERLEEEGIARDDDWKVQNSWNQYKRSLADFEGDFFSTDEVWLRNDVRSELFDMLDHAVEETRLYWVDKDEEDRTLTEGIYIYISMNTQMYVLIYTCAYIYLYIRIDAYICKYTLI